MEFEKLISAEILAVAALMLIFSISSMTTFMKLRRSRDRAMRILNHARQYVARNADISQDKDAHEAWALLWSLTINYWTL